MKICPALHIKCPVKLTLPLIPEKQAALCIYHQWWDTTGIFFRRAGPDQSVQLYLLLLTKQEKIKLNKSLRKCYLQECYQSKAERTMVSPYLSLAVTQCCRRGGGQGGLSSHWAGELSSGLSKNTPCFSRKCAFLAGMWLPDSAGTLGALLQEHQWRCRHGGSSPPPELAGRESCSPLTGTGWPGACLGLAAPPTNVLSRCHPAQGSQGQGMPPTTASISRRSSSPLTCPGVPVAEAEAILRTVPPTSQWECSTWSRGCRGLWQ